MTREIEPTTAEKVTPLIEYMIDRDDLIEAQQSVVESLQYGLDKQRAVIADLQSQLDAIRAHQAEVRAQFERRYCALILRVNKAERDAAKWHGIAIGAIEEVTE